MGVLGVKKLCKDAVRDALLAVGRWPLPRDASPHDFSEEERFRMFKSVMHEHVWPVSDIIRYEGRIAFSWMYSVWTWRHGGRRRFAERIRAAAAEELAGIDYSVYDLTPIRNLIGDDGARYCRLLHAADVAEMEQRMNGMEADLKVVDRKIEAFRRTREAFGEMRYRIDLYDNSYEAVIRGGKGGWLWTTLAP